MTRRHFVTLLATLVSWVSMRPKVHADAVKASFKTPEVPDRVVLSLWDCGTHVESLWTAREKPVRRLTGFPSGYYVVGAQPDGAVFLYRGEILEQVDSNPTITICYYEYVSGPKWWATDDINGSVIRFVNGSTITFGKLPR